MNTPLCLVLLALITITGCSSNIVNPSSDKPKPPTNAHYTRDAVLLGLGSVVLGSLAVGNIDRDFKTTNEGWFEKDSKYAGMDKLGHAWYGNAVADFLFERNPNKKTHPKSSAALASAVSMGIMTLVEISDGFADNIVGFSPEDMVANAAGAGFAYLRNTNPNLKKLVDYRIEYRPNYSKDDGSIDTFYADQKYLLAWKLSGIDALKGKPLRFFEIHTGYYARGYSSKEVGDDKQRNGFIGVGVDLSELLNLGITDKNRAKPLLKFLFEHVQLPHTRLEASMQ